MTWFLAIGENKYKFSELKIHNVHFIRRNQTTDRVTFDTTQANFRLEPKQYVEIFHNGTRAFAGIITSTPFFQNAEKCTQSYEISGLWWQLEHLVYQQAWLYGNDANTEQRIQRGNCILGQDVDGNSRSIKQCLEEIITYVQSKNVSIKLGEIKDLDTYFPPEFIKDCTCAEVIQRILRWVPDTICWFDYSQDTITLNIQRHKELRGKEVKLSESNQLTLKPRYDLQVNGVVLKYEYVHQADHQTWRTHEIDCYPQEAENEGVNTLILSLELAGIRSHLQEQAVCVKPIKINDIAWWKEHFPTLAQIPESQLTLNEVKRNLDLPNELVSGAIASWMPCKADYDTCIADISYSKNNTRIKHKKLVLRLCATNGNTQTYRHQTFLYPGTTPPQNLAKTLYESLKQLQYEGQLCIYHKHATKSYLGQKIKIKGLAKFDTFLMVQEEDFYLDQGKYLLQLGTPKHLGPQDFVQFIYANRNRNIAPSSQIRNNRTSSSFQTATFFPQHTPQLSTFGNEGSYEQLTISEQNKTIELNTQDLPENTKIQMKAYDVVESGELKKVWLLSS